MRIRGYCRQRKYGLPPLWFPRVGIEICPRGGLASDRRRSNTTVTSEERPRHGGLQGSSCLGVTTRRPDFEPGSYPRVRDLCDTYADSDIGFVDAAVFTIVERLGEPKLVTRDHRHFPMLRPRHVEALRLLPERGHSLD